MLGHSATLLAKVFERFVERTPVSVMARRMDPSWMLATHTVPCEDGHAQERSLSAKLIELVDANVLERTRDRMVKWLRRRGLLLEDGDAEGEGDGRAVLAASAVSGTPPPAGPERRRGALPFERRPMVFERRLCVALDGFTLHAATRAGGHDEAGREALVK